MKWTKTNWGGSKAKSRQLGWPINITKSFWPSTSIRRLHNIFEKLSIHDEPNITHRSDTILLVINECSALSAQHLATDAPKSWEEAQRRPEAAEWKAVIDEELKSLKDMGVYKLIHQSELPHNAKIRKGLIILTNCYDFFSTPVC